MPHILKNKSLEVHIDLPLEGYRFSRFDWTGKITRVIFNNIPVTTIERTDDVDVNLFGMGLYNEFGIESAIGYEETSPGDWFHKIGVGALKKTEGSYQFTTPYEIRPAEFNVETLPEILRISCKSDSLNGFSYMLTKEFSLKDNSLILEYRLENTGQKLIRTDEYVHNFMGVDKDSIGMEYELRFPFEIDQQACDMVVNPDRKMIFGNSNISFNGRPKDQLFVSYLNGRQSVSAIWELIHHKSKIGMREIGSFSTQKVNLWGWQHVLSPELFHKISIEPGSSQEWSRTYEIFNL